MYKLATLVVLAFGAAVAVVVAKARKRDVKLIQKWEATPFVEKTNGVWVREEK